MATPLRELRIAAGLSQRELAERAGVAAGTVFGLEAGGRHPYPRTRRRIAAALGVAVTEVAEFVANFSAPPPPAG